MTTKKVEQHTYPKRREVWVCELCGGIIKGLAGGCWCDVEEDGDEPIHAKKMIEVVSLEEIK
jgi:hypothetical protein